MSRKDVPGTTYLVHLDPPYKHAKHYLGFAEGGEEGLKHRLDEHTEGRGARLLAVVKAAGGAWHLTRTWPSTTRSFERQIKDTRHVPRYCPDCQPDRAAARREARAQAKEKVMAEEKESGKVTVGELAKGVAAGTWTRGQAAKAIADLEVIHWGAEVDRPSPEIADNDLEMEL